MSLHPGRPTTVFRRVLATWHVPVLRTSYHLFATTGLNAALGLVYWVTAARLYPPATVGAGAGAISAMMLVASGGWIGLQYTLMRYIPVAGDDVTRLVAWAYGAATGVAVVVAVVFLAAFAGVADLGFLAVDLLRGSAFVGAVVVWTVFSLQDAVLIGLRKSQWVPLENAAYGALKLLLLAVLATTPTPWGVFGSWILGTVVFVVLVNGVLCRRRRRSRDAGAGSLAPRTRLARFTLGQHTTALVGTAPDYLVPLIVLTLLDRGANAYYYAAWSVSLSVRLLALNIASALTVEGALAPDQLRAVVRRTARLAVAVLVPVSSAIVIAAEPIMSVFGDGYGSRSADVLRVLTVGLIPFTVTTLIVAVERVHERTRAALAITAVAALGTVGLTFVLVEPWGLLGAGFAWVIGQTLGVVGAAVILLARCASRPGRAGVSWRPGPASRLRR